MKITSSQLRRVIAEEVRRRLSEGPAEVAKAEDAWVDAIQEAWQGAYDSTSPSMAAVGPEAWESQVEEAVAELVDRHAKLVAEIEDKLWGGQYG